MVIYWMQRSYQVTKDFCNHSSRVGIPCTWKCLIYYEQNVNSTRSNVFSKWMSGECMWLFEHHPLVSPEKKISPPPLYSYKQWDILAHGKEGATLTYKGRKKYHHFANGVFKLNFLSLECTPWAAISICMHTSYLLTGLPSHETKYSAVPL